MPHVESQQQSERHSNLQDQIREIHGRYQRTFPIDECGPSAEACMDELEARSLVMPFIRAESHLAIAQVYGFDSDEAHAAQIVSAIGTDLDGIFLSQLSKKGGAFRSWRQYDSAHSEHLVLVIGQLTADPSLAHYFEKNPETRRMFDILKELATSDTVNAFEAQTSELEHLAIDQYKARKPVLLFELSDWYMDPNRDTETDIQLLEPDCRLILPYEDEAYEVVGRIVVDAVRDLAPFYPPPQWKELPTGIIGNTLMWAGSQIVSYTVGESFNGHGFTLAPNILKTYNRITETFHRANLPIPDDLVGELVRQYILHELGHSYFHPADTFMDEITTDIPKVLVLLQHALTKNDEKLTEAVAMLLGEYLEYAGIDQTGEANSDGYRISSIFVTNKLLEYNLVAVLPDGRLHIHQTRANCKRLIDDLTELHQKLVVGDQAIIDALRSIHPSEEVRSTGLL